MLIEIKTCEVDQAQKSYRRPLVKILEMQDQSPAPRVLCYEIALAEACHLAAQMQTNCDSGFLGMQFAYCVSEN